MTRSPRRGFAAVSARAVPKRRQRRTARLRGARPVSPAIQLSRCRCGGALRAMQDGLTGAAGEDVGGRGREERLQHVAGGIVDGEAGRLDDPRGGVAPQDGPARCRRPTRARRGGRRARAGSTSVGTPSAAAVQVPPPSECRTTPSPTTQTSVALVPKMARSSFGRAAGLGAPGAVAGRLQDGAAGADRPDVAGHAPQAAQLGGADDGLRDPAAAGARVQDGVAAAGDVDVASARWRTDGEEARGRGGGVGLRGPGGAAAVQDGRVVTDEEDVARGGAGDGVEIDDDAVGELRRPGACRGRSSGRRWRRRWRCRRRRRRWRSCAHRPRMAPADGGSAPCWCVQSAPRAGEIGRRW